MRRAPPLKSIFLAVICFSFSFVTAMASEVECKNVDLRDRSVVGPVRNQGSLGWCFAYAAADLYGHALKKRLSPIDIALSYYQDNPNYIRTDLALMSSYRAGRQDYVYNTLLLHGVCEDNKVSAFRQDSAAKLVEVEKLANQIAEIRETGAVRRDKIVRLVQKNFLLLNQIFPTSNYMKLRDAFLDNDDRKAPLVSLVDNICGDRIPVDHLRMRGGVYRDKQFSLDLIKINIGVDRRPVLIGYNAGLLKNPSSEETKVTHASTIMGTRKVAGKCQYLLKNSWGSNDRGYHWTLRTVWQNDGDYTWIPESMMKKMAQEIRWLQQVY